MRVRVSLASRVFRKRNLLTGVGSFFFSIVNQTICKQFTVSVYDDRNRNQILYTLTSPDTTIFLVQYKIYPGHVPRTINCMTDRTKIFGYSDNNFID